MLSGSAVAYLILNPPSDLIRSEITQQVKLKTGRDLVVAGPASITFYPGAGVSLQQVALSAPPGMTGNLITMESLDISVKALPLFQRNVEVRRLVLNKPVFDLRISKSGKRNWDFAESAQPVRYAQAAPAGGSVIDAPQPPVSSGRELPARLSQIRHLQFDDVRIVDGTMRLTDERTGKVQEITAVNVNLGLKSLNSPLVANGNLGWKGQSIDFDGKLSTPRSVLEEKPAQLTFNASNTLFKAAYEGAVFIKDGADLEGQVNANASSARRLASWLGTQLPPVTGFGPLAVNGTIKTNGNTTTFTNAAFGLDGATANGTVTVKTGAAKPYFDAHLQISELDLNKYLVGEGGAPIATESGGAPARTPDARRNSQGAPQTPGGGDAIENLLNAPATKVYGATQREGWSSDTINLTLLGVADGDAKLQIGRLFYKDIKIGQTALVANLRNRVLKTSFDDVRLYDGRGKGFVNVDGTGKAALIGANVGLEGIAAQAFLKDAAGFDWLSGKANIALQLSASGLSQLQFVETLGGKADIRLADGAVKGFNVAGMIRGLQQGKLGGLKSEPSEKTDFSEMKATFAIANGIAQNQDLSLVSPLLRVTGGGAVQLPPRTIDYTIRPKLVASLEGQESAQSALSGIEIPVRIIGPWSKPKYEPDLKGVLANPDKAVEAAKEIGKKFKGKSAGEIADELFGTKNGEKNSGAKELLNKFLKPQ